MKLKIALFTVLTQFVFMHAQTTTNPLGKGIVLGKIIDQKTKEEIPYATITVKEGEKVLSGAISDEKGVFSIKDLPFTANNLEIQFMGYKKFTQNIVLSKTNPKIELGEIVLQEDITELEGVSVVKERSTIEQKIDRKVVNVGKDLIASGATASEIMNNIPSVSLDPQTKEISLRGNSNVQVLVDGKPTNISAAQLLQQIPSSSIKQIELITNPSAKYNPEGMSGIINIILHKNANNGFNGSVNAGVNFGITPKTNNSLNLNYKVGKVNVYANYGLNHGKNANNGYVNSFRPNLENNQVFVFDDLGTSNVLKVGMDYYLDEKNTISFFTNQSFSNNQSNGLTDVDYKNTALSDSRQLFISDNDNQSQTYDLVYKHDFAKKGEEIEFQTNYSNTKDPEYTNYDFKSYNPLSTTRTVNDIYKVTDYLQINLDYVNPLTETTKIEIGAETRNQRITNNFLDTNNNINSVTPYSKLGNSKFAFNRDIYSLYTNYNKQWNKWNAQLGARLEYYQIKGDFQNVVNSTINNENFKDQQAIKDDIFTIYPSAFLTYTANEKNSFNFNYSRRVDRPSEGQINPIREWTTPLVESRGNPNLVPQFTNSFEVNYTRTLKIGSITSGVFYRQINDEINRTIYKNPSNINQDIISYINFDSNNAYGVEVSSNLKLMKWWSVNASVDAYFKTVKGTVQNAISGLQESGEVDVVAFNTRINQTFTATKNLSFNLFGFYRGRDLGLQFERMPMYKTDFGATYKVLKGKGSVTARLNDVFNTMHFEFDGSIPYKQDGAFFWESQTFNISFNYRFGGGKNNALQRKNRDNNETQGSGGLI